MLKGWHSNPPAPDRPQRKWSESLVLQRHSLWGLRVQQASAHTYLYPWVPLHSTWQVLDLSSPPTLFTVEYGTEILGVRMPTACLRDPIPSSVVTRLSRDMPPTSRRYFKFRALFKDFFFLCCSGDWHCQVSWCFLARRMELAGSEVSLFLCVVGSAEDVEGPATGFFERVSRSFSKEALSDGYSLYSCLRQLGNERWWLVRGGYCCCNY